MNESQKDRGQQWLEELLSLMGVPAPVTVSPAPEESEEEGCWLTIDGASLTEDQAQLLIGSDGTVLDAVQYLANTLLNLGRASDDQMPYTVELNGYRAERQAALKAIADQAASQARETGEEVELKSLSSAERRQVHTFLKDCEDLETYSRGREPDRRLVIRPRSVVQ